MLAFLSVSETPLRERLFIGAFGVKGVASVYYAAVVLGEGLLPAAEARTVFWTVAVAVMLSVVAHGASASALARRLLER